MTRDVIVVGASAGGVESLRTFLAEIPADLPAAVLVVLHLPSAGSSMLPSILHRVSTIPVSAATGHDSLRRGHVLVAPPDYHLVVLDQHVVLSRGPRENGHRPAVDALFRSAARTCGSRVIGVVLSGALDDGTAGMLTIRQRGGLVLAQDPLEAPYPGMPKSVIDHVGADHVGSAADLGRLVAELVREGGDDEAAAMSPELLEMEVGMAALDDTAMSRRDWPGDRSGFSCPDCDGTLFAIGDGELLRYRCRVGHAWSARALSAEQSQTVDRALWMAVRSLEERAALNRQLAERAEERGNILSLNRYLERAAEATGSAAVVRRLLTEPLTSDDDADEVSTVGEEDHVDQR